MSVDASASSGRECMYFQTNAFDTLVVPPSLEPGKKQAFSSFEEYEAAERKIHDEWYKSKFWIPGDELNPSGSAPDLEGPDYDKFLADNFTGRMQNDKATGNWKNVEWLEQQHKNRAWGQRSVISTQDANKFEEKRANITLGSSTALTMATSSANLQRQNVMRSIAGGDNIV
jgi:hypothetical protein